MIEMANRVSQWAQNGNRIALAIVTETWGSSPREVGSIMAIREDGIMAGSVSGGCIEGAVVGFAQQVIQTSKPLLARFSSSNEKAWEVGAPCGGDIEILIVPYNDEVHGLLLECILNDEAVTFVACLDGISYATEQGEYAEAPEPPSQTDQESNDRNRPDGPGRFVPFADAQAVISNSTCEMQWMERFLLDESIETFESLDLPTSESVQGSVVSVCGARMFCCKYGARPRIVCIGAVHIAAQLTTMAKAAGYETIVIDPRSGFIDRDRFRCADRLICSWPQEALPKLRLNAQTAVCALTHDEKIDVPALAIALESDAFYLGCLGHAETLLSRKLLLEEMGANPAGFNRIYGPIGLWIGGRTPGEIALSTLAQIQAVRCGRIDKAQSMPGHTMDFFTPESVARIAASRAKRGR